MKKYLITAIIVLLTILPGHVQAVGQAAAETTGLFDISRGLLVEVQEFSRRGDSLHVIYAVYMDRRVTARFQGMSLTPTVGAGNARLFLPSIVVVGPNKGRVLTRYYQNNRLVVPDFGIDWRSDHEFTYRVSVPFESWMDNAQFVLYKEVQGYRANSEFSRFALSNQIAHLPAHHDDRRVVGDRPPVGDIRIGDILIDDGRRIDDRWITDDRREFVRDPRADGLRLRVEMVMPPRDRIAESRTRHGVVGFQVSQSVILPSFRNNASELHSIKETIGSVIHNPDAELEMVRIRGYASPEGPVAFNEQLSWSRASALQEHIRSAFGLPPSMFQLSGGGEDWEGLEMLVRANPHLPQRDRVLQILTTIHDSMQREAALRALGPTWRMIANEMLPVLRRAESQIDYTIMVDHSTADAINLIHSRPEVLSHYQMFQVAELYGRGSERAYQIITQMIVRHFQDDALAHSNAAALMIQRGDIAIARAHLARAGNIGSALNNRGVIALLEGDFQRAEEYFIRAQVAGSVDAAHNRTELRFALQQ